jgi:hypothetical protein
MLSTAPFNGNLRITYFFVGSSRIASLVNVPRRIRIKKNGAS